MSTNTIPNGVLIVDDHPMVRDGLTTRISGESDLVVCGEAEDCEEALRKVAALHPAIVIVDISLKQGHGIDLIKEIRRRFPQMKMLVHSMYDESVYAERSLRAGALGYINKQAAREHVVEAIRQVLAGKIYVSSDIGDRMMKRSLGVPNETGESPVGTLSNRELQVLTLIGEGCSTRAIATQLNLSVHTIDTYREKLKLKLALKNSTELNRFAVQWVLENG